MPCDQDPPAMAGLVCTENGYTNVPLCQGCVPFRFGSAEYTYVGLPVVIPAARFSWLRRFALPPGRAPELCEHPSPESTFRLRALVPPPFGNICA